LKELGVEETGATAEGQENATRPGAECRGCGRRPPPADRGGGPDRCRVAP
jgi:hypothetical protein